MRNIFIALSFCLLFVSCEKEENLVEQKIQGVLDLSDMQNASFNDGVFEIRPGGFIEFEALYSGRLHSFWESTNYVYNLFVGYFEDSQRVYHFRNDNDYEGLFAEDVVVDVKKGMKIRIENFSGSEESILLRDIVIKGEAVKEDEQEDSNFDF